MKNRAQILTVASLFSLLFVGLAAYQNCSGGNDPAAASSASSSMRGLSLDTKKITLGGDMFVEVNDSSDPRANSNLASGFEAFRTIPWVKGVIPVEYDAQITASQRATFETICKTWGQYANITCKPRTGEWTYLFVTGPAQGQATTTCMADVGAGLAGGKRIANFGLDCWSAPRVLLHEFGHVLGFMHEHQRPDRDKYLDVHIENAIPGIRDAFTILPQGQYDSSTPYDFESVMHYNSLTFSANGRLVFSPKPAYASFTTSLDFDMWMTGSLSEGDKKLAAGFYPAKMVNSGLLGAIESATVEGSQAVIRGWACQPATSTPVDVQLYVGGAANAGGAFVQKVSANGASDAKVSQACQDPSSSPHRFAFSLDAATAGPLGGKTIFVHAISLAGGPNVAIDKSGQFTVPMVSKSASAPTPLPTPIATPLPVPTPFMSVVYRFGNVSLKDHLFSLNENEVVPVGIQSSQDGWVREGAAFRVFRDPAPNTLPLYRCTAEGRHFVSAAANCEGYSSDGTLGYVYQQNGPGLGPIYRRSDATTGDHLETMFPDEGAGFQTDGTLGFTVK